MTVRRCVRAMVKEGTAEEQQIGSYRLYRLKGQGNEQTNDAQIAQMAA